MPLVRTKRVHNEENFVSFFVFMFYQAREKLQLFNRFCLDFSKLFFKEKAIHEYDLQSLEVRFY